MKRRVEVVTVRISRDELPSTQSLALIADDRRLRVRHRRLTQLEVAMLNGDNEARFEARWNRERGWELRTRVG